MSGFIVKGAHRSVWSGSGVGDPENPSLGRAIVDRESEAHVFDDLEEARTEARTYAGGAVVMQDGQIVTHTVPA